LPPTARSSLRRILADHPIRLMASALVAAGSLMAVSMLASACDGAGGPACESSADCTDGADYCAASAGGTCCTRGAEGCGCLDNGLCDNGLDCEICAGDDCNGGDGVCKAQ